MGLFDGLKGFVGRINAPGQDGAPSFTERLNTFGASLQDISDGGDRASTLQQAREAQLKNMEAQKQRQQLAQMADQLGLSPKEKLLFMVNPQAFGNLIRDQEAPYSLSEGQQRFGPGGQQIAAAPKTMTFGDQIVSAGPDGVQSLFTRPKTYEEMQRETQAALNNDFERQRIGIQRGQLGVSQGQLGVAQGNLGLSRKRFDREGQGGGGLGQMTTEQLLNLARGLK